MAASLDDIKEDLDTLRSELNEFRRAALESNPSSGWKLLEKIGLPIALGLLTVVGAYWIQAAANQISKGQLELAEREAAAKRNEFADTMEGQYFQIFYTEITSQDPARQANAIALMRVMRPPLAESLEGFVQGNPQISAPVRLQVRETSLSVAKGQVGAIVPTGLRGEEALTGYTIGIYYLLGDDRQSRSAEAIRSHLVANGVTNEIAFKPSTAKQLEQMIGASGLEVRFDPGAEEAAARQLSDALQGALGDTKVELGRVQRGRTPNFISIFVPSG